ncbi:MAG: quinolinate synthase NadA, partial [archaeon]|nr:quinolinate synthase NadA [archaeon]
LKADIPDKTYYPLLENAVCKTMKYHTLEKVRDCLINEKPVITVPKDIAENSLSAVERMLEASK